MKKSTLLLLFTLCIAGLTRAQTTLFAGDLVFTGFSTNAAAGTPDTFSFVLLVPISSTTTIYFSDRGYNGSAFQGSGGTEGTVAWSAGSALPIGSEVQIHGLGGSAATVNGVPNGTVVQVAGGNAVSGLSIGNGGDQLQAFQNGGGDPTAGGVVRIAGIHFSNCTGTSDATWDPVSCASGPSASAMMPGLVGGTSAFWAGAFQTQGKFVCTGTPYSTVSALRTAIMTRANWTFNNNQFTTTIDLPAGCTFYSTCTAPSISIHPANRSICAAQNTTFPVTASGTGLTYQWQVNTGAGFTPITNGGVYSGATSNTLTITGATTGMSAYAYRCAITGTCGSVTSNSASLTVSTLGQWLGTTSSSWANTANWGCAMLPIGTTNVAINSGATFMPIIDISNAICNDLTIASGASLSFSGTTNGIDVKGAFTNNGTFSGSLGKVTFSGTSQNIPAATYRNLEMNGSGSKTLGGSVSVSGTLTLTSGHIILGSNNLTLGNSSSISGGSASSFVVTNGTGTLRQQNIGAGGKSGNIIFPVGVNTSSYTPLTINNTGIVDLFSVGVMASVYTAYAGHTPTGNVLNEMVVNRTWTIAESLIGGSNTTLSFQWNAADETLGFDRNRCHGSHYENNTWNKGATGIASGSNPYSISMSGVTTFSPFAVGTPGSTLPLTLQSFEANVKSNDVVLNWSTSNEINTAGFDVERSADGVSFTKISYVVSKENNTNKYDFTDKQLAAGNFKYRLKMTDKDGSHTFSNTIAVRIEAVAAGFELYPNPVTGSTVHIRSLNVQSDAVSIKIADLSGRIWHSETVTAAKINGGQHAVTVRQLPAGNYMMIISGSKDNKKQILQFTK